MDEINLAQDHCILVLGIIVPGVVNLPADADVGLSTYREIIPRACSAQLCCATRQQVTSTEICS